MLAITEGNLLDGLVGEPLLEFGESLQVHGLGYIDVAVPKKGYSQ